MLVDYVDEDLNDFQPCPICGDADNEELLLLCDGCDVPTHTYCVGLDAVPAGPWFCDQCETQRAVGSTAEANARSARTTQDRRPRRTRAQQRRAQNLNQANSLHWARVWQSVWDRLNIDLDFPFDDERAGEWEMQERRREAAQQREFRAWQRRFEVAERQGASHRFRDAAALLDIEAPRPSRPRVPREPSPEPESLEEMRAWNAFERAREIENDPSGSRRKRKEPTLSPSPEPAEPQRKLKRPRTRRTEELAALAMQNGESSRAPIAPAAIRSRPDDSNEPSFLQSLLREVEEASNSSGPPSYAASAPTSVAPTDHASPGSSSASVSPAPSNQSSPRLSASTPPPQPRARPASPLHLSSPAEPSSPTFSPEMTPSSSPNQDANADKPPPPSDASPPRHRSRIPHLTRRAATPRSNDTSPGRAALSLAVKSDVQRLVGAALKPYYRDRVVSKEEYTDINRTICRKLYDDLAQMSSLDDELKTRLEQTAGKEVNLAVETLRQQKRETRTHLQPNAGAEPVSSPS